VKPDSDCTPLVQDGDTVLVHYTGKLAATGKVFDSSKERGDPMAVEIGSGRTIPGFDQGLRGMCPGQQRRVTIPPELAYGEKGIPSHIPPQATLIFELECVRIDRPSIGRDFLPFLQSVSPYILVVCVVAYLFQKVSETAAAKGTVKKPERKKKK